MVYGLFLFIDLGFLPNENRSGASYAHMGDKLDNGLLPSDLQRSCISHVSCLVTILKMTQFDVAGVENIF